MTYVEGREKKVISDIEKAVLLPSCRLTVSLMTCFSLILLGLLRSNLTISLVCMVRKSAAATNQSLITNESISTENDTMDPRSDNKGEFPWSRQYQGFLLSAYFYGYLVTQLMGGVLAGKFGAKHVLGTSVLIAAIATLLTPPVARFDRHLLIFLRAMVGAGSGFIFPSSQSLLGVWAPPLERTMLSSFSFNGLHLGTMLAFLISSQFCQVPYDNGWPLNFYFTGGIVVLFLILWNILVFSSPEQHPRISQRELNYIKSTTGLKTLASKERKPFPWSKALRSPAVVALLLSQTSHTWFIYTLTTSVALYFQDVHRFDINQNGLILILTCLMLAVTNPPLGFAIDIIRRKKILSTTSIRKLFQSISSFGSMALMLTISFLDYDSRYVAVAVFIVMNCVNDFGRFGFLVSPQDIAPRYSGELFGIANTVASLSGILAPIVVGQLTPNGTQNEWRTIFYIASSISFVGGLAFLVFAKGETVSWAKEDATEKLQMNQLIDAKEKTKDQPTEEQQI